jgi:hypothetical protein
VTVARRGGRGPSEGDQLISGAPVFINMKVPGLMITVTFLWIVTVP